MKLLKLHLQNINSLKGSWIIDFTSFEYEQNGLFAIIGETGAGKSTLLDAICLALYARTPRMGKITQSQNEIMHVGTAYCHSEVLIEIGNQVYRFALSQQRARNKANGLLQSPKREVAKLLPDQSFVILETKISAIEKLTYEILSMTFEQFTRSCLLAQGGFSAFLLSDKNTRGEILEKITGTHLYAQISKKAYEKNKAWQEKIKQKIEQLQHSDTNIEQTLEDLNLQIQKLNNHTQTYQCLIKTRQTKLDAITNYQKIKQEVSDCQEQLNTQRVAMQDFEPHKTKLAQAKNAHKLTPLYNRYIYTKEDVERHKNNLDEYHSALSICQEQCNNAKTALDIASQKRQQQEQLSADAHPLFVRGHELKKHACHLEQQKSEYRAQIQNLINTINNLQNIIDTHTKMLEQINIHLSDSQATIQKYRPIAPLLQDLSNLQEWILKWRHAYETIAEQNKQHAKRQEHYTRLQANKNHLNKQKNTIHNQIDAVWTSLSNNRINKDSFVFILADYHKNVSIADRLLDTINTLYQKEAQRLQIESNLSDYHQEYTTQNKALAKAKKDEKAAHAIYEQAYKALTHAEQAYDLGQRLQVLQAEFNTLIQGSPCTVCGSKEHPYKTNKTPPHLYLDSPLLTLEDIKTARTNTANQYAKWQQTISTVQDKTATLERLKTDIDRTDALLQEQSNRLFTVFFQFIDGYTSLITPNLSPHKTLPANLTQTLEQYYTNIMNWQTNHTNRYNTAKTAQDQLHHLEQTLIRYNNKINELTGQLVELKEANDKPLTFAHEKQNSCQRAIINILTPYYDYLDKTLYKKMQNSTNEDAYNAAKTLYQQLQEQQHIFNSTQNDQNIQNNKHDTAQIQLHNAIAHQQDKHNQQQTIQNKLDDIEQQIKINNQAKKEVFADPFLLKLVSAFGLEEAQAHLEEQKQISRTIEDEAKETHFAKSAALTTLHQSIKRTKNDLDTAQINHTNACNAINEALQTYGFHDINVYLTACLSDDEFENLNDTQKQINQTYTAIKDKQTKLNQRMQDYLQNTPAHWQIDEPIDNKNRNKQTLWQKRIEATKLKISAVHHKQGKLEERREQLQLIYNQQTALIADIASLREQASVWAMLDTLIGSAKGEKYRNYVQGLTLDALLYLANEHLVMMTDRYGLVRGEELDIDIIDFYQGGKIRSSKNLSGGENFLVSLSLALGLSNINSQSIQIDSLFLDEGFGTLDEEALDVALSILSQLQDKGKMIGIISHVRALKERIATQIVVSKKSGGASILKGAGVSQNK